MVRIGIGIAQVRLSTISQCIGQSLMLFIVMTEVLCGLIPIVSAIVGHRSPGSLERKQAQHKKHEDAFHGYHYTYYAVTLSMTSFVLDAELTYHVL